MRGFEFSRAAFLVVLLTALQSFTQAEEAKQAVDQAAAEPSFERDVRPILREHCGHCHGDATDAEGGLDLRLRRFMVAGGDSGPAVVPGKPEESLLYTRIRDGEMPPGETSHISADALATLNRWIATGAKTLRPEPEDLGNGMLITEEDRNFWSFQPIRNPDVPQVKAADRVRTPIDAFILRKLEEKGLSFAAEADRTTLIRRAHFDLLGLPPTPQEIDEFVADPDPQAYDKLIDKLLERPEYGERWGRHWLDVAGYADSEGYTETDPIRPWAWKYRDYVIRSLNADKPFDQFIREQLAGDEMVAPPYTNLTPEKAEKLIATGFLRMAPDGSAAGGPDRPVAINQSIADTVQIVSTSLLGMTVACAQCHHHKYDPIGQDDYYRFRAIFEPALDWKSWRTPPQRRVSLFTNADRKKSAEIEAEAKKIDARRLDRQKVLIETVRERELAKLPEEMQEDARTAITTSAKERTAEQKALIKKYPSINVNPSSLYLFDRKAADELKEIAAEAKKLRDTKPKEEFIRALTEVPGKVPTTHLFIRGDHEQPGDALEPASLQVLSRAGNLDEVKIPGNLEDVPTTGRRLEFARRLTAGDHPLTARVLVNRIWLHHFGRGIVSTPADFGALGEKPTHPELLDWLATDFMSHGWTLKRFHKLIMTSSVYRQVFAHSAELEQLDPDNRLLGRMTPRRLEAEVIRDAILKISGKFNPKRFGPPVPVMADRVGQFVIGIENLNAGRPGAVIPMKGEEFRRSLYVQVRRTRPLGVLSTFDFPAMDPLCESRASSTVAPQSLMLMNSNFVVEQSDHFATRVGEEAGEELRDQARLAWRLVFGRTPDDAELDEAVAFLTAQQTDFEKRTAAADKQKDKKDAQKSPRQLALASYCQMLLSSNAFLYVD